LSLISVQLQPPTPTLFFRWVFYFQNNFAAARKLSEREMTDTSASAAPVKETKAQRVERIKREKNPWQAFDEIRRFAREGRASVTPEWISSYFRWWGTYTQGDGIGAIGGKGGEGLMSEYFMMRIGTPNGLLK